MKGTLRNYGFADFQSANNLCLSADGDASLDFAFFKLSIGMTNEYDVLAFNLLQCAFRYGDGLLAKDSWQFDIGVHVGFQFQIRIRNFTANSLFLSVDRVRR